MKYFVTRLIFAFCSLSGLSTAVHAAGSCDALLTQGIYNVSFSTSSSEGESMAKSQFCQSDYSFSSSSQKGAIEASFMSWFSGGASKSDSQIIETQKRVCTSGFNSSSYSNSASSYSRTIYQGALDAWNQCNALANRGVLFEIQPDNTNMGVSVSFSAPTGTTAKFLGVSQTGIGTSVCKYLGTQLAENSPMNLSSAYKVSIVCSRNKQIDGSGNYFVDAQSLFFNTSAGMFQVPLSGTAMLSRVTLPGIIDTVKTEVVKNMQALSPANLPLAVNLTNGLVYQNNSKRKYLITYYCNATTAAKTLNCNASSTSNVVDGAANSIFYQSSSGTDRTQTSCVVPAGYYYKVSWTAVSGVGCAGLVWEM